MKIKSLLLILHFFFNLTCFGQVTHEFKIDILGVAGKYIGPHYELGISKKLGIEIYGEYDFTNATVTEINGLQFMSFNYDQRTFHPGLMGKYYFLFNKKFADGIFVGPVAHFNFLLDRDANFAKKWEEVHQFTSDRIKSQRGIESASFGLIGGYKWLINPKLVLEFQVNWRATVPLGLDTEKLDPFHIETLRSYLTFGYRIMTTRKGPIEE